MSATSELELEIKQDTRLFGGRLVRFSHASGSTGTRMTCSVFLPPKALHTVGTAAAVPLLMYLSGLTCTDENVCIKSGIFRALAEHGIAMVAPDTSPRGAGVAGETDSWDFGVGAGFYVDATEQPWSTNYRMYSYITEELVGLIARNFPVVDVTRMGVTGHSMGGHGALTIALKNQDKFRSVSAFAPICNPIQCPWGQKAFSGYLGSANQEAWKQYDACALVGLLGKTKYSDILIDVGTSDSFLTAGQLHPEKFVDACTAVKQPVTLRYQGGYDHSYYFVSTFVEDHVKFHAQFLNA